MSRVAGPLLPALVLAACSRSSAPAPSSEPPVHDPFLSPSASAPSPEPAASAVSPRSSVRLLDRGQEPLRVLRYAWHVGQKELMTIDLRTAISAEAGGSKRDVPLPPLHVVVDVDPVRVSPDGDLSFNWRVESAKAGVDAGTSDPMMAGWSAQMVPVEHLSGTGAVTSHGISKGIAIDSGTAGDAGQDAEMVVQVVQMLRDMAAPLPDEPVGKGARWQKLSTLDAKSGRATQTDTYTLVDTPSDAGALDDVFAQSASPQPLPSPIGVASASPAQVDSLLTSGNAKVRFDLSRLVPQTTLDGTTSMALSAPTSRMNMVMRLGITVVGTLR